MIKFFKHIGHVLKHKWKVFILCCRCGLFWRGFWHDTSKFSFVELKESIKYYKGNRSPLAVAREENGYTLAWIHHKNRNKHHIEYWYDAENKIQIKIPYKYLVEGVCDKISATKCYKGKVYKNEDTLNHWLTTKSHVQTHPKVIEFYDTVLYDLKVYGEKYVINKKYLKNIYKTIVINENSIYDTKLII